MHFLAFPLHIRLYFSIILIIWSFSEVFKRNTPLELIAELSHQCQSYTICLISFFRIISDKYKVSEMSHSIIIKRDPVAARSSRGKTVGRFVSLVNGQDGVLDFRHYSLGGTGSYTDIVSVWLWASIQMTSGSRVEAITCFSH
ncbi:hypothetical protein NPIL_543451 [Nephila pilipes]|uniref:Uncharacterized protein n=1 Tax=Nephila pilipes TaxID=299642 RepID=A0A8X6T7E1_NEPPI|nr:hypothetical protein NPIL_543451 [Nephila pilipes]